jgi:hypothetical protein
MRALPEMRGGTRLSRPGNTEFFDVRERTVALDLSGLESVGATGAVAAQAIGRVPGRVKHGESATREAILLSFCDPLPAQCSLLWNVTAVDWDRLLTWLDYSGLALYFLDRISQLGFSARLPGRVRTRLEQNLDDNRDRTRSMIAESIEIQQEFQRVGVSYALLKGLSLWPHSVPAPELRLQFDLDFLVAEKSARIAREALERRGYRLYHASRRSLEFKRNERPGISLKDIYKPQPSHAVELHIEPDDAQHDSPLSRLDRRDLFGCSMPVLSDADLLLGQGLHAYKHICGEFSRASHLLEFRRHVLARRDDDAFWHRLRELADGNPRASRGLGIVTMLITQVMDDFAPASLLEWTVRTLPEPARLWVQQYGQRAVLGSFPGTKLYLLLQKQLKAPGVAPRRSTRRILLPLRLPPAVIRAQPGESLRVRLTRIQMQWTFILLRLRFHVVEGLRYAWESYRWRRRLGRLIS